MITPELHVKIHTVSHMVIAVDEVLKNQIKEIYQIPKDERKPYLDEHFVLKDFIDEAVELINMLQTELDKRPTIQQYQQCKTTLTNARNYIEILGGNPSLLTYS